MLGNILHIVGSFFIIANFLTKSFGPIKPAMVAYKKVINKNKPQMSDARVLIVTTAFCGVVGNILGAESLTNEKPTAHCQSALEIITTYEVPKLFFIRIADEINPKTPPIMEINSKFFSVIVLMANTATMRAPINPAIPSVKLPYSAPVPPKKEDTTIKLIVEASVKRKTSMLFFSTNLARRLVTSPKSNPPKRIKRLDTKNKYPLTIPDTINTINIKIFFMSE